MKKRIWASLDDYMPTGSGQKIMGIGFANYGFFRALLEYGHFDEYHFFLIDHSHKRSFEENHGAFLGEIGVDSRVKLFYRTEMPRIVSQYDHTVFHQSNHISHFNSLCHFRNRHGSFPVTSFIHSISYPGMMLNLQEMHWGGVTSSDAIICSSKSGRDVLENCFEQIRFMRDVPLPPVKMEVIPFGFEGSVFDGIDREASRKQSGLPHGEIIALCFGRFSEYDKMDLFPLLQAFHKIYRKGHPWRLVLAGAAHQPEYVTMVEMWTKALGLEDAVTIKTDIPEDEKIALFKSADFFVSPSDNLQETFGLTLIEALAAGLPLVVSDFSGYREIGTPDVAKVVTTRWADLDLFRAIEWGPLFHEGILHRYLAQSIHVDMEELSLSMMAFFSNPGLCREMGKAARKRFHERYDYKIIIQRLEALWLKLKGQFDGESITKRGAPLFPDYFQVFSHYFSEILGLEANVGNTPFSEKLIETGQDYPLYAGMEQLIDTGNIRRVITYASEPKKIGEIIEYLGGNVGKTHYQVMWMLKHGLLEIR